MLTATRICMWHAAGTSASASASTSAPAAAVAGGNHLTAQPLNRRTTQPLSYSFIYVLRAGCNIARGFCCLAAFASSLCDYSSNLPLAMPPLLSASARPLAAGILIKLKWCCKIYFISHSSRAWTWTWTRTGRGSGNGRSSSSIQAQCAMWEHLLYAHGVHINYPGKLHGTWRKLKCGYCQRDCVCKWVYVCACVVCGKHPVIFVFLPLRRWLFLMPFINSLRIGKCIIHRPKEDE